MVFLPIGTAVKSLSREDNLACLTCANLVLCSFSFGMLLERLQFEKEKKKTGAILYCWIFFPMPMEAALTFAGSGVWGTGITMKLGGNFTVSLMGGDILIEEVFSFSE